jgi:prepilin-type N-terminal cleavage/methylation domain-containing protein
MKKTRAMRGYTLIELIIAVGLFGIVMTLSSGAYLVMISLGRQSQSVSTGIDNLSFALETMTRTIRTGTSYSCGAAGDCANGDSRLSVRNAAGTTVTYALSGGAITQNGSALTEPLVTVSSLVFYVTGTRTTPSNYEQPHATIIISGTIASGPGKTESFTVETGATMRGTDL